MRQSPLPREASERLAQAKVGVAGCGGMGSHVATALARTGVGRMVIADFDTVDPTNLFRQCYVPSDVGRRKTEALSESLLRIEPDLDLEVFDGEVTEENACDVFSGCDVVCECFDRPDMKAMLVESILSGTSGTVVVSCSGMAGFGSSNLIATERRMSRLYVCGDGISESGEGPGLTAARVMVCAGHVANMAVRIVLGDDKP